MKLSWPVLLKAIFLLLATYFFLYMFNHVFKSSEIFCPLWDLVIPSFAKFCGYDNAIENSYGGDDTVYNFFKMCFCVVVAFVVTVITLFVDFKRDHYNTLQQWLTVCIRYFVFYMMFSFSIRKFLFIQFPPLTEDVLNTKLGDFDAENLLFSYMSYSRPYVLLVATIQMVGGLLLLSRKTVMLGALISIGVMFNMLMVNLFYNNSQKILCIHLVLMLLYLILLNGKALFQFFILQIPVSPNINNALFSPVNVKVKGVFKFVVITFTFFYFGYIHHNNFLQYQNEVKALSSITHFFGVYNIQQNSRSIDGYPLGNLPDYLNWKVFYQSEEDRALTKTHNDSLVHFAFELNIRKQFFRIKSINEDEFYELPYEHIDTNTFRINGSLAGNYVDFTMHRTSSLEYLRKRKSDHKLINDKFKWIRNW